MRKKAYKITKNNLSREKISVTSKERKKESC